MEVVAAKSFHLFCYLVLEYCIEGDLSVYLQSHGSVLKLQLSILCFSEVNYRACTLCFFLLLFLLTRSCLNLERFSYVTAAGLQVLRDNNIIHKYTTILKPQVCAVLSPLNDVLCTMSFCYQVCELVDK